MFLFSKNALGSPPPMRGKVSDASGRFLTYRITPAYAGKSDRVKHCGSMLMGSPPPMRGKASMAPLWSLLPWDHPRLCGEKGVLLAGQFWKWGSPPPMRGKARHWQAILMHRRITPAYAGKRE